MTVDRYTKLVLTVIAVCLVWIAAGGPSFTTPVSAQDAPQRVIVAGWADPTGVVRPFGVTSGTSGLPVWVQNK